MEDSKIEKPTLEHPFSRQDAKEQDPQQMIFSMLGEITNPSVVISDVIRNRESWRLSGQGLTPAQNKQVFDDYVSGKVQELISTGRMIEFRDAAQELYKRYTSSSLTLQSTRQAYFLKRTTTIWEQMREFTTEFLEYGNGRINLEQQNDPEQTLTILQGEVERTLKILRDKKGGKDRPLQISCSIQIPKEPGESWDREEIRISFDSQGKIEYLYFDELYSHTKYCEVPSDVIDAYENGADLTYSQKRLLKDHLGVNIAVEENSKEVRILPPDLEVKHMQPILIFQHLTDPQLRDKVKASSTDIYKTPLEENYPFRVDYRWHDYGDQQFTIPLDTRKLSNSEVFQLIGSYLEALKYFPRVPKVKKNNQ